MSSFAETMMERCQDLAAAAQVLGNTAVGAVIVKNGNIVAEAGEATKTKEDITAHAEMEALRIARAKLGTDLSGCELYTTKAPCVMCAYAIRYHKLSKLVYRDETTHFSGASMLTTSEVPKGWGAPVEIVKFND